MKILMIAPEPFFKPRGTPFSVYHRLKALSKMGHQVHLLTYHIGEKIEIEGVKITRIPDIKFIKDVKIGFSWAKIPLWFMLLFYTFKMLLKEKYDCIHTHEDAVFIGVIIRFIFKIPHIYDMHSSLPEQFVNYKVTNSKFFLHLASFMEKIALKNSDGIIAICPSLMKHVKSISPSSYVEVIENVALVENNFKIDSEKLNKFKKTFNIKNEDFVIGYTGTLEHNQGIDLFLKSLKIVKNKINNIKCLLVGGEDYQIEFYKKMAKSLGVDDIIIFTGRKPVELMPYFMELSDILVSPRIIGQNTPLKIYSYMNSNKPILATRLPTHLQVLNDSTALLVQPDEENFANGILKLASDKKLRETLAKNAKEKYEKYYNYENYLNKIDKLYNYILNRHIIKE